MFRPFRSGVWLRLASRWGLCPPSSYDSRNSERDVRFSEFFRLRGAGFRILPLASLPYYHLNRLPKRWFRLWLVYHHPRGRHPIPWLWWLSAGRKVVIPPEAIGVLHFQLLERWCLDVSNLWTPQDQAMDEVAHWERGVRAPWLDMHLNNLKTTCLALIEGELIDPLLDYVRMKETLQRQPSTEGSSLALKKWSLSFRLYDRMTRILSKPLPKLLGT